MIWRLKLHLFWLTCFTYCYLSPAYAEELRFTGTTFNQLCSYDPLCRKLVLPNGSLRQPKRTILRVFQHSRTLLVDIAKRFKVDPRLIVAVITTEHTLNLQIDDVIQDIYARTSLGAGGRLGPIQVSYGFGQIYADAAGAAEPVAAEIEQRPQSSAAAINNRLQTIEGALTYAAALLVHAQRVYAARGIDIAHHPGVLATLYNIGKVEARRDRTISQGQSPNVNYFGWFVEHHWEKFSMVLEDTGATAFLSDADYEAERILGGFGLPDQYPVYYLRGSVPLFFSPDACRDTDRGDARVNDYQRVLDREMRPKAQRGEGKFNVLQQVLGCEGEVWALARFSSGTMGWLREKDTRAGLEFRYEGKSCRMRDYSACVNEVRRALGEGEVLDLDATNGLLNVRIVNFGGVAERDHRKYQDACFDPKWREALEASAARMAASDTNAAAPRPLRPRQTVLETRGMTPERPHLPNQHWWRGEELENLREQIAAVVRQVEEFTGRKVEGLRENDQLERIFHWLPAFRVYCSGESCIGPEPKILHDLFSRLLPPVQLQSAAHRAELEEFVEVGRPLRNNDDIIFFDLGGAGRSRRVDFSAGPEFSLYMEREPSFDLHEQWHTIEQACHALVQRLQPAGHDPLTEMRAYVQEQVGKPEVENLWLPSPMVKYLKHWCEIGLQVIEMNLGERARTPIPPPFPCSPICPFYVNDERFIDLRLAHFFLFSEADLAKGLQTFLRQMKGLIEEELKELGQQPPGIPQQGALGNPIPKLRESAFIDFCRYDPLATIQRIEALLRLPCVDQVLVPRELHLLRRFSQPDARGTMGIFNNFDRFQISLKPECRDNSAGRGRSDTSNEIY